MAKQNEEVLETYHYKRRASQGGSLVPGRAVFGHTDRNAVRAVAEESRRLFFAAY